MGVSEHMDWKRSAAIQIEKTWDAELLIAVFSIHAWQPDRKWEPGLHGKDTTFLHNQIFFSGITWKKSTVSVYCLTWKNLYRIAFLRNFLLTQGINNIGLADWALWKSLPLGHEENFWISTAVKCIFRYLTISRIKPCNNGTGEVFLYVAHRDKSVTGFIERGIFLLQTECTSWTCLLRKQMTASSSSKPLQEWHKITIKFTTVMIITESNIRMEYQIFSLTRSFQAQN